MTQANQTATNSNDISSHHAFRGYITQVVLETPKPQKGQKRESKPYYLVKATLHNGRSSGRKLKYLFASFYVDETVLDTVEDVYKQFEAVKSSGEEFAKACHLNVVNLLPKPYLNPRDQKLYVQIGGTITDLTLTEQNAGEDQQQNESSAD